MMMEQLKQQILVWQSFVQKYEELKNIHSCYRAPEIYQKKGEYSFQLDVWNMGCFAVELSFNRPLFNANNEIQQIFEKCGTPTAETWPEIMKSDYFNKQKPQKKDRKFISSIRNINMAFDDELLDSLDKIFVLNLNVRLTVEQVLKQPFLLIITQINVLIHSKNIF